MLNGASHHSGTLMISCPYTLSEDLTSCLKDHLVHNVTHNNQTYIQRLLTRRKFPSIRDNTENAYTLLQHVHTLLVWVTVPQIHSIKQTNCLRCRITITLPLEHDDSKSYLIQLENELVL